MIRRLLAVSLLAVLLAGCGGSNIEITNDSGSPISGVRISAAGTVSEWDLINHAQTVSAALSAPLAGVIAVTYTSGTMTYSDTIAVPEGCENPSSVSIWIAGDATSIKYDL